MQDFMEFLWNGRLVVERTNILPKAVFEDDFPFSHAYSRNKNEYGS